VTRVNPSTFSSSLFCKNRNQCLVACSKMSFANSFGSTISWDAVTRFSDLSPKVLNHVKSVYTTLFATILAAALGSMVFLTTHFGGTWSMLVGFGLLIWLSTVPQQELNKRLMILAGFGFAQGLSLGPLLEAVADIDPTIIITAFFGTCVVFACFSASALYAKRRSYLYLGGLLSSSLSLLLFLSLFNLFFRSSAVANVSIYFGLLVFSGFIIFDTQLMIERADQGNGDVVWDALSLFLDFINVFVRLLAILAKNGKKERK